MSDPVTILAVVSSVVSLGSAIYAATLNVDTSSKDIGTSVTKSGTSATRNPVYGKCIVGSTNVYNNIRNDNARRLLSVFALGIGEFNAIHQVYIDDVGVFDTDENNFRTDPNGDTTQLLYNSGGNFSNQSVQVQMRTGIDTEIPLSLAIENSDGEWTSEFRGDRVAQVAVAVNREIKSQGARVMSPKYQLTALVSGLSVYDPRDPSQDINDRSTWKYSDNSALCTFNYLTDTYFGVGIPLRYFDINFVKYAANYCDTMGFKIAAEVPSDSSFSDNLNKMLRTFGGILVTENGYVRIKYESNVTVPVMTFNEDNIIGGGIKLVNNSSSNYYNIVQTSFKNPEMMDKEDILTLPADVTNNATINSDGFKKTSDLDLSFCRTIIGDTPLGIPDPVTILTNRELKRAKYQKQIDFDVDLDEVYAEIGFPLEVYDVIAVENEHYGWGHASDAKMFRITSIKKSLSNESYNTATISCMEYSQSIFEDYDYGNTSEPLPPQSVMTPPAGLSFNQKDFNVTGYGVLTWNNTVFASYIESEVEYKRMNDASWTVVGITPYESIVVSNLQADVYAFRVRSVHPIRGVSKWSVLENVEITSLGSLPAVTGASVVTDSRDIRFNWDNMLSVKMFTPEDIDAGDTDGNVSTYFSHYFINIYHLENGSYVYKRSVTATDNTYVYSYENNLLDGLSRDVKFDVVITAKDGTISPLGSGSSASGTNQQMAQPAGLSVMSKISMAFFEWLQPTDLDYFGTIIHISDTSGFTPSENTKVFDGTGSFIYYWDVSDPTSSVPAKYARIGHYDIYGKDNINWSPEYLLQYDAINNSVKPYDPTELENTVAGIEEELDAVLPAVSDQLSQIRNPDNAPVKNGVPVGTSINVVSSPSKTKTAGYGLYSKDDGTSLMIIAADKLVVAGGKGSTDTSYGSPANTAMSYSNGKLLVNTAIIANLTSSNIKAGGIEALSIKAGTITANECEMGSIKAGVLTANSIETNMLTAGAVTAAKIAAGTITGDKINSKTYIHVGSVPGYYCSINGFVGGEQIAFVAGATAQTTAAKKTAPFRVSQDGKLTSTSADIKGVIRATQLIFESDDAVPSYITNIKTTADNANANASTALSTAKSAQAGVTTINGKMYLNQTNIQIKSSNYVAGRSGWAINQGGSAEFSNVIVRGSVYANTGSMNNVTINSSCKILGSLTVGQITGDVYSTVIKQSITKYTDVQVSSKNSSESNPKVFQNMSFTTKTRVPFERMVHGSVGDSLSGSLKIRLKSSSPGEYTTLRYCNRVFDVTNNKEVWRGAWQTMELHYNYKTTGVVDRKFSSAKIPAQTTGMDYYKLDTRYRYDTLMYVDGHASVIVESDQTYGQISIYKSSSELY